MCVYVLPFSCFWQVWPALGKGLSAGVEGWDSDEGQRTTEDRVCWKLESWEGPWVADLPCLWQCSLLRIVMGVAYSLEEKYPKV